MEFRYNEIIIWLIPGLYLLCLVCLFVLSPFMDNIDFQSCFELLKQLPDGVATSATVFFIPFVSFVMGYLINYIASQGEYWLYCCKYFKRPSRIILEGKTRRYKIVDKKKLLMKLGRGPYALYSNSEANDMLSKAKQSVDISSLDTYYFKSILGRNLLCAQVLFIVGLIFDYFLLRQSDLTIMTISAVAGLLFFASWRRNCKIYVRHIFALYLRSAVNSTEEYESNDHK